MARLFGGLGVLLLVGAVLWWGVFYGAIADAADLSVAHTYADNARCLLYAYDGCAIVTPPPATPGAFVWPVYQPVALWLAGACLFLGILMPRERRR